MPAVRSRASLREKAESTEEPLIDDSRTEVEHMSSDYNMISKDILRNDYGNIGLLIFLYLLQGIPLGLAGSIPMFLQSRNVSYQDQAVFSFVFWPFSLKLLWAPVVDAAYVTSWGRRKSWLVPIQYLIGFALIVVSYWLPMLLDDSGSGDVDIIPLTILFILLNFLAATQDIAVDGWALSLLHRENLSWASTCNSVGQTAGYFLASVVLLQLESKTFANNYVRPFFGMPSQSSGLVTLGGFMCFWGIVFLVTTTLVGWFKREKPEPSVTESPLNIRETYMQLWKIVRSLPSLQSYMLILLTAKIGFAAADGVTGLKLIDAGLSKDKLALLSIPLVPLEIVLPLLLSRYVISQHPMFAYINSCLPRLFMGLLFVPVIWLCRYLHDQAQTNGDDVSFPFWFYALIIFLYMLHQVTIYCMFVAVMAFHAQISDPKIGGTYMTLLNTLANLGGTWPGTLVLKLVDVLTWSECAMGASGAGSFESLPCHSHKEIRQCTQQGGRCVTTRDGYDFVSLVCFVIGVCWWVWQRNRIKRLQMLSREAWHVSR